MKGVRPKIVDLIDRKANGESYVNAQSPFGGPSLTNAGSVSWNATREAEELDDPAIAEELRPHLSNKASAGVHSAICFIIAKIGRNAASRRCAQILIERLTTAKRQRELSDALGFLGDVPKPSDIDIKPILDLLQHKNKSIIDAAVQALDNTHHPEAEHALIALAESTDDRHLRPTINAVLGRIGTEKSIPILEAGLKSRVQDTKISARFALEAIRARASQADRSSV